MGGVVVSPQTGRSTINASNEQKNKMNQKGAQAAAGATSTSMMKGGSKNAAPLTGLNMNIQEFERLTAVVTS